MIPDTFGQPAVLWALALAALPVLLHLLERRRAPRVDWPAMRFLMRGARRTLRRMRSLERLLLVVRVLVIAALVYAFARPASIELREIAARREGGHGAVLVIDNSLSMGFRTGGGGTLFHALKESARGILGGLRDGDSLWIVSLAQGARSVSEQPFRTVSEAMEALDALRLERGHASIVDGLDLAADLLASVASSQRSIHILTDFDADAWSLEERERWSFVLGRLDALEPSPLRQAVSPLDSAATSPPNRSLLSLDAARSLVGTDRPVDIVARALRYGEPDEGEIEIALAIDDGVVQRRHVSLASGEPTEVRFPLRFDRAGPHRIVARLEADALPFDDARYLAIDVAERVPVLILSDGARAALEDGFPGRIDLALAPHAGEETAPEVIFEPRSLSLEEALSGGALESFCQLRDDSLPSRRVVVLVDSFPEGEALRTLDAFVQGGGGLLVFAGKASSALAYNRSFGRSFGPVFGRASGRGPETGSAGPRGSSTARHSRIHVRREHPALQPFRDMDEGSFDSVRLQRWNVIDPGERESPGRAAENSVPMEIEGEAVLVARRRAKGRILICGLSGGPGLSDLPDRPVFVPWIHGLISYLASPSQTRSVELGSELSLDVGPAAGTQPHVSLRRSDGSLTALAVTVRDGRYLSRADATEPGFYTFYVRRQADEREQLFAVNPPTEESRVNRLTESERETLQDALGIAVVTRDGTAASALASRHRREHWPLVVAFLLGLLLIESALTRLLAHRVASPDATFPGPGAGTDGVAEALRS